ncbi:c-type cytochrome [Pontibacterium granulatum]|uniref:c-type cytochrome n=1 Tax=Pontibacterium granulatum TaxID=2036029 RepID=UPI00249BCC4A|nr:c-type cytochrome [Pontibacterium granulatum]MDI3325335.1 c-type cytochrome [Pontibacterium granulatum]
MKKTVASLFAAMLIASPVMADGQAVFEKHCKACHDTGLAGAPKTGDAAAWQPRIAKGVDAMLATVKSGKGAMPPKGTCASCDDAGLTGAIQVFVDLAK